MQHMIMYMSRGILVGTRYHLRNMEIKVAQTSNFTLAKPNFTVTRYIH